MNDLRQAVENYLVIRRGLGFRLRVPATLLHRFAEFVESEHASHITTDLALRWATQPSNALPSTWTWRLGIVRRFAVWHRATDPRTEVPPEGLLPHRYRRKSPYIYSDKEIETLMQEAGKLSSPSGLRAHAYSTLFALLAVTGMRINEALHLDRGDVDLLEGILTIRRTKFGKSRLVPVHASTRKALNSTLKRGIESFPDL